MGWYKLWDPWALQPWSLMAPTISFHQSQDHCSLQPACQDPAHMAAGWLQSGPLQAWAPPPAGPHQP